MEPLKQWVCDVCGHVIENNEDAYVVWGRDKSGKINKMRIVHKNYRLDDGTKTGCDWDQITYNESLPISCFLGAEGIAQLLALIDPGCFHVEDYADRIADVRLFVEMFRRFQIPYYEEARFYLSRARADGFLWDSNEVDMYLPSTLKKVIDEYAE